jgi:protein Mpv17
MMLLSDQTVSAVNGFYQSAPFLSAFLTCAAKGLTADFMAQKKQEQEQLDISRSLAFLLYGGLYQGVTLQALYSEVFPALFGPGHGHIAQQVGIDLTMGVCLSLPLVYTLKAFLCEGATDAMAGVKQYQRQMQSEHIHLKYIGLWAPVQTINFSMVPAHLHVPFSCCFSLLWLYILSSTSAQQQQQPQQHDQLLLRDDPALRHPKALAVKP